jgi:hypothetical protein
MVTDSQLGTEAQGGRGTGLRRQAPRSQPWFVPLPQAAATHTLVATSHWYLPGAQRLSPAGGWRRGRPRRSGQSPPPPGEWPGCKDSGDQYEPEGLSEHLWGQEGSGVAANRTVSTLIWQTTVNMVFTQTHHDGYTPQIPPGEKATFLMPGTGGTQESRLGQALSQEGKLKKVTKVRWLAQAAAGCPVGALP